MFEGCTNLKEIVIPETVKTIGAGAFKGCTMESIVIPASVTKMDYTPNSGYVFEGWTAEQTIYVCISEAEAAEKYAEGWSGEATVVYNYDPSNTEHSEN
jgi:hypothetical protein